MPENGYLGSSHPSYALRARSAGAPPKNRAQAFTNVLSVTFPI